jgi:hypothetical protein
MSAKTITFEAIQDDDAWQDDPREWNTEPKLTAIFRTTDRSGSRANFTNVVPELVAFHHAYEATGDDDLALRAANHYSNVYGTGRVVATKSLTGYSQSDWWDVVTVDEGDAKTFGQWLRGDVWSVFAYEETECDHGDIHRDVVESLGGVYADDADAAIEYFKADYYPDMEVAS